MVLADLDNDATGRGDQLPDAAPLLYRNDSSAPRVAVRLKGRGTEPLRHRRADRSLRGPVAAQVQEMLLRGALSVERRAVRTFAAGSPTNRLGVKVTWRNWHAQCLRWVCNEPRLRIDQTGAARTQASGETRS